MDFKFKFPSLKEQAMVRLVEYLINKQIARLPDLPNTYIGLSALPEDYMTKLWETVLKFPLPITLKHEFYCALSGIYFNASNWYLSLSLIRNSFLKVSEFFFDMYGQLDEQRTWQNHFDGKINSAQDMGLLLHLLRIAVDQKLLPEIDKILKKILEFEDDGDSETLLVGPRHEIRGEKHVLIYTFGNSVVTSTARKMVMCLGTGHRYSRNEVDSMSIVFTFNNCHSNFQLIKNHLYLLQSPDEKKSYIKEQIKNLACKGKVSTLIQVVQFLQAEDQGLYDLSTSVKVFLRCFLTWPYTKLFISTLKVVPPVIKKWEYFGIFHCLVFLYYQQKSFDQFYGDLVVEFCHNLPPQVKDHFREAMRKPIDDNDEELSDNMKSISKKDPLLYQKITQAF